MQTQSSRADRRTYEPFRPPKRLLLGPGPNPVDDRILAAMAAPSVPDGVDDARVRAHLLAENIEIGGGLGPLKGRIWRIGLMGSGSTRENVLLVLEALHHALNAEGFSCASGIEAAQAVY